jgi:hypothetical protein
MQQDFATELNGNVQEEYNDETQVIHTVTETQNEDPFEDPGENLGRLQVYLDFIKFKIISESDYNETYSNEE